MWEAVTSVYKAFVSLMMTFKATDVLDIMIVAFIIYNLIKIVRETRAEQLVKGILVLIVAFFISGLFSLKMLNALFSSFFQFSVLAVLIVFQPELRRVLEKVGRANILGLSGILAPETDEDTAHWSKAIDAVCEAAANLSATKTGALIILERKTKLGEQIATGTILNCEPSPQVFGNIFFPNTPLHDGAVIIRNGTILAAGCFWRRAVLREKCCC